MSVLPGWFLLENSPFDDPPGEFPPSFEVPTDTPLISAPVSFLNNFFLFDFWINVNATKTGLT